MPEKFYKVFVSSTYEDLKDERQEVFDALLKCNCFPVGMEHFPGSNLRSLDLIQKYIGQCDYFVMVSAGVYGSPVPDQSKKISYVEWEYDYAKSRLPCYSFLIADPNTLTGDKLEKENPRLLEKFHRKVKDDRTEVKFYTSAANLNSLVLHTFQHAPKDSPTKGWIRGNNISTSTPNELVGAWQLVSSNIAAWNGSRIIKLFSESEFMWVQIKGGKCEKFNCGYYERGAYGTICELPRETNIAAIKDKVQDYQIQIEGDILTTDGPRSTGVHVEEKFSRLDLNGGVDIWDNL